MRDVVSFDAYGTLVDFDLDRVTTEILGERLALDGLDVAKFLDDFRVMRFQAVLDEYRPYREVLRRSLRAAMLLHGLPHRDEDGEALVAAVPRFGPFADVPEALRALKERHDIAIISNTDDDLIAGNIERIGVTFDYVVTAQQARAYKPSRAMFEYAFARLGRPVDRIVHVAQGWEYDIMPTWSLGVRRIWINRHGRPGSRAFMPYEELTDLTPLPGLLAG